MSSCRHQKAGVRAAGVWLLASVLVWSTAVSLAYRPAMHHDEDCPMPMENRGAPTVLNAPVTPPPLAVPVLVDRPVHRSLVAPCHQHRPSGVAGRVRARAPPVLNG